MHSWRLIIWILGLLPHICASLGIPLPAGRYNIGTAQHVINHTTKYDPTAPNGKGESFLVTLYYPTLSRPKAGRPYVPKELATLYETAYFYPTDSLANTTTILQDKAPTLGKHVPASRYPILVFGPGGAGPPSSCYTALLSDLASHGYTVAALDHPYEQPFLQYPNKSPGIFGLPTNVSANLTFYKKVYDFRISETASFLGAWPWLVKQYDYPFNKTHSILFGHSLGGAAALGATHRLKNSTILGAINLDGTLFGAPNSSDATAADIKKPVLMFGNGVPHNFATDRSWLTFPSAQTGWWREITVSGSLHLDFSDISLWKGLNGSGTPEIGLIEGKRMVSIVRTFVLGFMNMLRGERVPVLDGPSVVWPEVVFQGGRSP
jgi:hypothetical protein